MKSYKYIVQQSVDSDGFRRTSGGFACLKNVECTLK